MPCRANQEFWQDAIKYHATHGEIMPSAMLRNTVELVHYAESLEQQLARARALLSELDASHVNRPTWRANRDLAPQGEAYRYRCPGFMKSIYVKTFDEAALGFAKIAARRAYRYQGVVLLFELGAFHEGKRTCRVEIGHKKYGKIIATKQHTLIIEKIA